MSVHRRAIDPNYAYGCKTPHLPCEIDWAQVPFAPVVTLWHSTQNRPFNANPRTTPSPVRSSGTDAIGGLCNINAARTGNEDYENKYCLAIGDADWQAGGRTDACINWPPYPRSQLGLTEDNTFARDSAIDMSLMQGCGITINAIEPLQLFNSGASNWTCYTKQFDGANQLSGATIYPATQIDSNSLFNQASTRPDDAAESLAPYMLHPRHFNLPAYNVVPIFAFNPINLGAAWWTTFLAGLASRGVNSCLAGLDNGWANNNYKALQSSITRTSPNQKSWAGNWGVTTWNNAGNQTTVANYVRLAAQGSQQMMWMVKPHQVRTRSGQEWYNESGGWRNLVTCYNVAIANKVAGDGIYLCTWNDAYETQMRPGTFNQWALTDVCAYYNYWFRTGSPPEIVRDCLYYSHRQHAYDLEPNSTYQPHGIYSNNTSGSTASANVISVLVFLTDVADVIVTTSAGTWTFSNVPAGVTLLDTVTATGKSSAGVPLPTGSGGRPNFKVKRGGTNIININSALNVVTSLTQWQNLGYCYGSSLRMALAGKGYNHPYIEPVELFQDWPKGQPRYGA